MVKEFKHATTKHAKITLKITLTISEKFHFKQVVFVAESIFHGTFFLSGGGEQDHEFFLCLKEHFYYRCLY